MLFRMIPEANNPERFTHFHITYELILHFFFLNLTVKESFQKQASNKWRPENNIWCSDDICYSFLYTSCYSFHFCGKRLVQTPLHRLRKSSCAHALDYRLLKYNNLLILLGSFFFSNLVFFFLCFPGGTEADSSEQGAYRGLVRILQGICLMCTLSALKWD